LNILPKNENYIKKNISKRKIEASSKRTTKRGDFGLFQQYHNKIDNHRIYHKLIAMSCMRYSARGVELFGGRAVAIERIKKEKILLGINIGILRVDAVARTASSSHHTETASVDVADTLQFISIQNFHCRMTYLTLSETQKAYVFPVLLPRYF